jgi:hypothetical protein
MLLLMISSKLHIFTDSILDIQNQYHNGKNLDF